jgi:hypothetical protein
VGHLELAGLLFLGIRERPLGSAISAAARSGP